MEGMAADGSIDRADVGLRKSRSSLQKKRSYEYDLSHGGRREEKFSGLGL